MPLSIEETENGRKVTGYLAGDNDWLLPNEKIVKTETHFPSNLPLVNYDTPYWGAVTYVAYTEWVNVSPVHTNPTGVNVSSAFTVHSDTGYNSLGTVTHFTEIVPVGSSLTSKPKIGGTRKYKPKKGRKCARGYRLVGGMCVKQ
jgi:hypothetical protein